MQAYDPNTLYIILNNSPESALDRSNNYATGGIVGETYLWAIYGLSMVDLRPIYGRSRDESGMIQGCLGMI